MHWFLFILSFFPAAASAQLHAPLETQLSQLRPPGVSFEEHIRPLLDRDARFLAPTTPYQMRVSLAALDLSRVTEVPDAAQLNQIFKTARDKRYLFDRKRKTFARRISWLYPDDGCATRAELLADLMMRAGLPAPTKVFLFGDLEIQTPYHPKGALSWWYHVAVAYRVGQEVYVLDPSVIGERALPLSEWTERLGGLRANISASLCDAHSFNSDSTCTGGAKHDPERTIGMESWYLTYEWARMIELKLAPERVLGAEPPWLIPN